MPVFLRDLDHLLVIVSLYLETNLLQLLLYVRVLAESLAVLNDVEFLQVADAVLADLDVFLV